MLETYDLIAQIGVFFTGVIALYLAGSTKRKKRMWAGIVGMIGEPFWLMTAILNEQWPVVLLVAIYFFSWFRVYWNNREEILINFDIESRSPNDFDKILKEMRKL